MKGERRERNTLAAIRGVDQRFLVPDTADIHAYHQPKSVEMNADP